MSGRARTTIEESARTTPTASASAHTRGFGLASPIAQLRTVLRPVLLLAFEHEFDVGARFRIGDVFDLQVVAAPLSDRARAGVVGGERRRHVAFVGGDPFGEQVGPVFDVDFGIGEVGGVEGRRAGVTGDVLRRFRGDLHQAARAGARFGLGDELRLGVDHRGDQGRVDALFLRLLADDVFVFERQREFVQRLMDGAVEGDDEDHGDGTEGDQDAEELGGAGFKPAASAAPGPRAPPDRFASSADRAASRSSTEPSLTTTWSARSAFSSWVSWRASRASTRAWPREAARSRRTPSAATIETVVSKTSARPPSKSSGTSTTATFVSSGSPAIQPAVSAPTSGWSVDSSHFSCSGWAKTMPPIRPRSVGAPSGATSGPQRSASFARSDSLSSRSWTTASLESVAAPSRPKAASASDLPAAMPPVSPIVSGATRPRCLAL